MTWRVCTAWTQGIATLFHPAKPRLEYSEVDYGDVALPMNVVGVDNKTGKLLALSLWSLATAPEAVPVHLHCGLFLRSCGTGAWDTSTAGA